MSALSDLAGTMSAGTWAELSTSNFSELSSTGGSGNSITWGHNGTWDPSNLQMKYLGTDHYGPPTQLPLEYIVYDEAANSWSSTAIPFGSPVAGRHGYDHSALNPYNGDLYYRDYTNRNIYRYPHGGSISLLTQWPTGSKHSDAPAVGLTWWSGSFQGAGAQGALIIYNSGVNGGGQMLAYDPLGGGGSGAWIIGGDDLVNFSGQVYTYHSVAEYSPVHNCVYFGGGNGQGTKNWRLNSDRSITTMADAPVIVGIANGTAGGNITVDPVTGNFLILSQGGSFYEFVPTGSGTWTQLTGLKAPPSGLAAMFANNAGNLSFPISTYGVVGYVAASGSNPSGYKFYVYKHTASTPPPPTPSIALFRL